MKVDENSRSTGTVCTIDHRRKPSARPEQSMQHNSGSYLMSQASQSNKSLQDPVNSPDLPVADRALESLRASQKLIHLGRMAASIAHEVNNPLESITNLLYLIRSEPGLSPAVLGYLELAEREMERVVAISKQTLHFARETSEPLEVSVPGLLEEVLILYRRRINEKQLRIVQRYTPTEPIEVFPGEMRQVLANLIVNAIEACAPRGAVTLRVRPAFAAHGAPAVRITIADNGTGIPPEVRSRLGEPFFTTKGQDGTGLGLWVTRSILERYGGQLDMRSIHISEPLGETRHGTVSTLCLPLRTEAGARSETTSGSGPVLVPRSGGSSRGSRIPSVRRTGNDG
jgi:signal transduction histidine kinase